MTETEWLASADPYPMLDVLRCAPNYRKLRLFGVACCRRAWDQLPDPRSRKAVIVAELYADGDINESELLAANAAVREITSHHGRGRQSVKDATAFVTSLAKSGRQFIHIVDSFRLPHRDPERMYFSSLLRDIFGNPFRSVTFAPEWRTDTATVLAAQMYESRDFSAMPILADALQDAGCDNADILNHCRDANQVHVRGCWVVDLVLGKA